ncbi:MAG TPA: DUF4126 domain-containing protein [Thermoanaerobaculia bacterium]|nr:DUF4126 domain-containing protein [Thermoanaerobaculia bacterium]
MTAILTGLGLAAAAGLNAWAVLLLFHGLVRLLPQDFPGPVTAFLASPFVFQLALVLFLAEFIVTKIPLADRIWEAVHTLLRPIVGALLALASVAIPSWPARTGVALLAAIVTLGTHAAKSTTRLTSTAATRGFTQFALSLAEDIVAVALAILLFFQPWLTALVLSALLVLLLTHGSRVQHALAVLFFRLQHPRRRNL